jgi:predicted DNA-binding antitoxin AbrB/MazE fold protein
VTIAVKAVHENGVFRPKDPVKLEERTEVELLIPVEDPAAADDPTGWRAIDALAGSVRSGLKDVSEKHDEYLYSDPRA